MEIKIRNCKFGFRCDKTWGDLATTRNQAIRFCGVCRQNVHYVHQESELLEAIKLNRCVALVCQSNEIYPHLPLTGKIVDYDEKNASSFDDFDDSIIF